jgi:alpha-tubulin suppressor-like RCC1 family protein
MTTELYVWGSDCMGQLGLNSKLTKDKAENQLTTPKSCSFNI